MKKYTCQCMRCNGTGRYDRGACFGCNGTGYKNQTTKPRALEQFGLTVTYENKSKNYPVIWASSHKIAVQIVERMLRVKGWTGTVE